MASCFAASHRAQASATDANLNTSGIRQRPATTTLQSVNASSSAPRALAYASIAQAGGAERLQGPTQAAVRPTRSPVLNTTKTNGAQRSPGCRQHARKRQNVKTRIWTEVLLVSLNIWTPRILRSPDSACLGATSSMR
jgi:hypothetical protein